MLANQTQNISLCLSVSSNRMPRVAFSGRSSPRIYVVRFGCRDQSIMDPDRKLGIVIPGRDRESGPAVSHEGLRNQTVLTAIWPCPT